MHGFETMMIQQIIYKEETDLPFLLNCAWTELNLERISGMGHYLL